MLKIYLPIILLIVTSSLLAQNSKINTINQRPTKQWEQVEPSFDTKDIDSLTSLIMHHKDPSIRKRAGELLGLAINKGVKTSEKTIADLVNAWEKEKDGEARASILNALASINRRHKDNRIQALAIKAFRSSPSTDWDKVTAIQIIDYFGGNKAIELELIQIIATNPSEIFIKGHSDNERIPLLWTQLQAANCLGTMKSQKAVTPLFKSLTNLIKNEDISLKKTFANEASFYEMYYYTYSGVLAKIGGENVISLCLSFIDDESKEIRYIGAKILGKIGDSRAVPILCEILGKSTNSDEKVLAIYYLEDMKDKRAIPALKEALKDKNTSRRDRLNRPVALAAYHALIKFDIKVEVKYPKEGEPPVYRVLE